MEKGAELKLKLYNSKTKQKEIFTPKEEGIVKMYVCGITAYDYSHIGHARVYVTFDILYRFLKHLGYNVTYVRNFTDIDDKIINRASQLCEDPIVLSDRFSQEFLVDMDDLQCLRPTYEPRVSNHIEQIKEMIAQIICKGFAYTVDGDVYFSVNKFPDYGQLSKSNLEGNRAGGRVMVDSRKQNPADFALWKAAKPGEPTWDSAWGPGRPGWHIECSAMSSHYLTNNFDIHGGGIDLIFPHHENEIAQNCAAQPGSNISYWLHNEFVNVDNEKISKSLGNFFTIREVTKIYHPLALRHFLLSKHYRSPVNYTISEIVNSSGAVFDIYKTLEDSEVILREVQEKTANDSTPELVPTAKECILRLQSELNQYLSNDLDTKRILEITLPVALRYMNTLLKEMEKQPKRQLSDVWSLTMLEREVRVVLDILGLLSSKNYSEVLFELKDKALKRVGLTEEDVSHLIERRAQLRENKEFSRGDQIRDDLGANGIDLKDENGKPTMWEPRVLKRFLEGYYMNCLHATRGSI